MERSQSEKGFTLYYSYHMTLSGKGKTMEIVKRLMADSNKQGVRDQ
jgi:hypothetical protein